MKRQFFSLKNDCFWTFIKGVIFSTIYRKSQFFARNAKKGLVWDLGVGKLGLLGYWIHRENLSENAVLCISARFFQFRHFSTLFFINFHCFFHFFNSNRGRIDVKLQIMLKNDVFLTVLLIFVTFRGFGHFGHSSVRLPSFPFRNGRIGRKLKKQLFFVIFCSFLEFNGTRIDVKVTFYAEKALFLPIIFSIKLGSRLGKEGSRTLELAEKVPFKGEKMANFGPPQKINF